MCKVSEWWSIFNAREFAHGIVRIRFVEYNILLDLVRSCHGIAFYAYTRETLRKQMPAYLF